MIQLSDNINVSGLTFSSVNPNIYKEYNDDKDGEVFEKVVFDLMLNKYSEDKELTEYVLSLPKEQQRMAVLSLIDDDNNLWTKMNTFVDECNDELEHIKDVIKIMFKFVKDGDVEKKQFGEVMTPLEIVKEMLNNLPKEVWTNPDLKWLDPANGAGTFPLVVIYKLMRGLSEWEPNVEKRYKHIVENMIYTCELQSRNVFLWLCGVDPKDRYTTNTYWGSFLDGDFDYHMKNVWKIEKFDIVIGNPPYQEQVIGGSEKPLYNRFIEKIITLSDMLLFIVPSRWFIGGKGLDGFRKMMLNRTDIKVIKHFDDATKIFGKGVFITGGINYFLIDKSYNGNVNLNGVYTDISKYDILIKDQLYYSIIDKISINKGLDLICKGQSYSGIKTNDDRLKSEKITDDYIKCYVSKRNGYEKWVDKKIIKQINIDKWKVITVEATNAADASHGSYPNFGNKFIGKPNEICNQSYVVFEVDTEQNAKSLLSYLKTDFSNKLLSLRKISQHIKPDTCKWIPIVPFDREWTDELLFDYFNLTDEEKKLILN